MVDHSEVAPDTLSVRLTDGGIVVKYLDGHEVFYHGVPQPVETPHRTAPGKDVHVLVTDDSETSGVLMYIDERTTEDGILSSTGVGRLLLDRDERRTVFPGVEVERGDLRYELTLDESAVDGRVFVFEEDHFEECSYELTASPEDDS
jgi:hypothetical protein